jgi:hypothetical protein
MVTFIEASQQHGAEIDRPHAGVGLLIPRCIHPPAGSALGG